MQPLWYRDAVVYQVDVAFFRDADGDGWGDLPQTRGQDSLLSKVGTVVRTRAGTREIGRGECQILDVGCSSVLALRHASDGRGLLTLGNLSDEEARSEVPARDMSGFVDISADSRYLRPESDPTKFELSGYGYRWLPRREHLFR